MAVPDADVLAKARRINEELASLGTELGLAAAGMAPPPFGTAADVVSLGRDTWRAITGSGSWWDVAFSGAAFIPVGGDAAKMSKVAQKAARLADEAAEIAGDLAKMGPEGAKALEEMGGALGGLSGVGCGTLGIKNICAALSKIEDAKAGKGGPGGGTGPLGSGSGGVGRPGSKGKPDHQAKVEELFEQAKREAAPGETVLRERRIQGHDSRRNPDVQIVGTDGKTRKILEAERRPTHKRNKLRQAEYDKLGVAHETHPLGSQ